MIKRILLLCTVILAFFACESVDDDPVPDQAAAIEKFLNDSVREYEVINGVYRHFGARGEEGAQTVENGNRVGFMFEIYPSNYKRVSGTLTPDTLTVISTNKPTVHQVLEQHGIQTDLWPQGVYNAQVGSKDLIKGLNRGLVGCRQGDSVLLFITSDLAMGDAPLGPIAIDAAMLYIVNIESVTK